MHLGCIICSGSNNCLYKSACVITHWDEVGALVVKKSNVLYEARNFKRFFMTIWQKEIVKNVIIVLGPNLPSYCDIVFGMTYTLLFNFPLCGFKKVLYRLKFNRPCSDPVNGVLLLSHYQMAFNINSLPT